MRQKALKCHNAQSVSLYLKCVCDFSLLSVLSNVGLFLLSFLLSLCCIIFKCRFSIILFNFLGTSGLYFSEGETVNRAERERGETHHKGSYGPKVKPVTAARGL